MRPPWWQWPNILSLDAPVIALVWQDAFARTFGTPLTFAERAILFCAVWCVYAADHVADGLRLGAPEDAAPRHRFALRHRGVLSLLIVCAAATALGLVPFLPGEVIVAGAVVSVCVGLYFWWNQFAGSRFARRWAKEVVVGLVFAVGCGLVPFASDPSLSRAAPVAVFALICTANCLLISRLERERDIKRGEFSLAVGLPPHTRPARLVALVAMAGSLALVPAWPALGIAAAISAAGIWCGIYVERRFGPEAAAVWADAVLLSPLLALPFGI